jgi:hypothetical protein
MTEAPALSGLLISLTIVCILGYAGIGYSVRETCKLSARPARKLLVEELPTESAAVVLGPFKSSGLHQPQISNLPLVAVVDRTDVAGVRGLFGELVR